MNQGCSERPEANQLLWLNEEIAEVSVVISAWHAARRPLTSAEHLHIHLI
jgi:hypothetical protein